MSRANVKRADCSKFLEANHLSRPQPAFRAHRIIGVSGSMVILNLTQTCWAYRSNPMALQTAPVGHLAPPKFYDAEIEIASNIDQKNITFSLQSTLSANLLPTKREFTWTIQF